MKIQVQDILSVLGIPHAITMEAQKSRVLSWHARMANSSAAVAGFLDARLEQLAFSSGVSGPPPHRKAKCGTRAAPRNAARREISCEGDSLRRKQNSGSSSSSNRSRWQLFGALAGGAAAALGALRLPTGIADGDSGGGSGHGWSGGNHGNGGDGGGGGNHGSTALVSKDENESNQVATFHGLASLSSSATGKLDESLKPLELAKLAGSIVTGHATADEMKSGEQKLEASSFNVQPGYQVPREGQEQNAEVLQNPGSASSDGTQSWLAELIDSVLEKAGLRRRILKDEERKELAGQVAAEVLRRLADDSTVAKKYEIGFLKRLQREAFSDIMKSRERLDKLELSVPQIKKLAETVTRLKGRVAVGGAFVLMQDLSSCSSRLALEEAGLPVGLEVELSLKTPFREKDVLTTKCVSGAQGTGTLGGPFQLTKLSYETQVAEDVRASFVPLGAEAKDVVEFVNPVQDHALTRFARSGPALFSHCKGSAVGVTYESQTTMASLSEYLSGWGDSSGPLCLSTLAQFIHQPLESFVLSLTGLNRFWPSPPLPSSPGLHWSEMRPFILSRSARVSQLSTAGRDSTELLPGSGDFQLKGTSMQTLAVSAAVDLGGSMSVGGWLQAERGDWLEKDENRRMQWALSVGKTSDESIQWGLNVGSSRPDLWKDKQENDARSQLLQVEAFVKCELAKGFSLQPGMVYLLNKQCQTPALILRAEWNL